MSKKDQTTVNLSEKAQAIKDDLAPVFGLKNILSAGLILFGKLTSDQQKQVIAESNGAESKPESSVLSELTLTPMQRYQLDLFLTNFAGKSAGKKQRKTIIEAYCKDVRINDNDRKRLDGFVAMLENLPEDKRAGSWKASVKSV